jgi:Ca2+-binding RTX toxin-like protein
MVTNVISALNSVGRIVGPSDTLLVTDTGLIVTDGATRAVATGTGAIVVNHGLVMAKAVAVGDGGITATTGQVITNYGTIQSTGVQAMRWASTTVANVTLLNYGEISTTGASRSAISLDAGGNSITNHGTITSTTGVAIDILVGTAGRGNTITNTGLVSTGGNGDVAIDLDNGVDRVVNAGQIVGLIKLRGGADIYDGRGGHVSGSVIGGTGSDVYKIDDARTVIVEGAGGGIDTVEVSENYALGANVERLVLLGMATIGVGNDRDNRIAGTGGNNALYGGLGADDLRGYGGDDELRGGDGEDVLTGGRGLDLMYGGAGDDRFVFNSPLDSLASAPDVVSKFRRDGDHIDLRMMDANPNVPGNQKFSFRGTAEFTAPGQVRIVDDGADVRIEINLDADKGSEMEIVVEDLPTLSGADFLL